jgi:hypothetical protein
MAVDTSDVTTRKRNRSIVVSDKYSQLIEYEMAPSDFQSWISSASATRASYGTEPGRRTADFNIQPSDIGIAAVEEPDEDEPFDMDFLAS